MEYSACLHAILKTLKWKPITQHFKEHYVPVGTSDEFQIRSSKGKYALVNAEGEYAIAPTFVINTMRDYNYVKVRGPFVFKDGFEETDEAQYLIRMMQYPTLTDATTRKVALIRKQYADWIGEDKEVINILRRYIKWL